MESTLDGIWVNTSVGGLLLLMWPIHVNSKQNKNNFQTYKKQTWINKTEAQAKDPWMQKKSQICLNLSQ